MVEQHETKSSNLEGRGGRHSKREFGKLTTRLVALTLLVSALMSLLATALQVYVAYQRDRTDFLFEFEIVERSFRWGLESALWEFDTNQVEVLLEGIFAQPHIDYLSLQSATDDVWTLGTARDTHEIRQFPLYFASDGGTSTSVGTLIVHVSLDEVWINIRETVTTILLTNFAKTFVVAYALLLVFERLVVRHLTFIATHARSDPWRGGAAPLALERAPLKKRDELDLIVSAFNKANADAAHAHALVEQERLNVEATNQQLQAVNKEQSDFTYAVSHDLKSPINTISLLVTELADDEIGGDAKERKELLTDIQSTLARAEARIHAITQYSKTVQSLDGKTLLDLDELVGTILKDLQHDMSKSEASVQIGSLGVYRGNAFQIRMLFQNLIANALKYQQPEVAPVVFVRGDPGTADDPAQLVFEIEDNGIGIAPEHRERVFGLFQRLHAGVEYEGSGLGLAVVRRVVENNKGSITLRDAPSGGTIFRVCLGAAGPFGLSAG